MSIESVFAIFGHLLPSKEERLERQLEQERIDKFVRLYGPITIITGTMKFPKTDEERLSDAEKEEKDILSETPPATAPQRDPPDHKLHL